MKPYVILISGQGSNMQALLEDQLPGQCRAVISNRPEASGLATAAAYGIPTKVIDHHAFASRDAFDMALADEIESYTPQLVLLAGFMRILSDAFVARFSGRMLNIHPSLLPAFPGIKTHAQALAASVKTHGCTVHFVTPALDGGPIIAQAAVPVLPDDTEESLAARVLAEEHRLYPRVARWFLTGQVHLIDGRVKCTAPLASLESAIPRPAKDR
ncbi:phosphoribosylglycinamide formyltransferase [Rugosibacter aromaticivorans]|uniref:Phosphoribosylglycinamide formyltransferase n=1 Tax=Rugosibacter aromaticivorans TaxID=1565605 RepID=A0A0C5J993_9PROT|nr:phosphoribosylglycinamide formyltransferase [Rugosibacter aromaticivorans]AJP48313.1 phosphoribosylglycinamide formyltransferase [Rugosibacter aromaticivorans]